MPLPHHEKIASTIATHPWHAHIKSILCRLSEGYKSSRRNSPTGYILRRHRDGIEHKKRTPTRAVIMQYAVSKNHTLADRNSCIQVTLQGPSAAVAVKHDAMGHYKSCLLMVILHLSAKALSNDTGTQKHGCRLPPFPPFAKACDLRKLIPMSSHK